MKTRIVACLMTLAILPGFTLNSKAQKPYRKINNQAFTTGERLEYRIHYGIINAARVFMQIADNTQVVNGRNTYYIQAEGRTISSFDWMFKVRDKFETYLDTEAIIPLKYAKSVREDSYEDTDFVIFDQQNNRLGGKKKAMTSPDNLQDVISAAYYARTINFDSAYPGQSFPINIYLDQKIYNLEFTYLGKETIKADIGKIKCIKLRPKVVVDRVFKSENAMTIWISDDLNRVPVRVKADIAVGSLKVDLTGYKNLRHPLSSKI